MDVDNKPIDNEILEALLTDAGEKGGALLEEIGKTDLTELTPDEWLCFVHEICDSFLTAAYERNGMHLSAVPF